MPIVDQDFGIAILRPAKGVVADCDLVQISGGFDLDAIQRQTSRDETIANRLRPLQRQVASRLAVALTVGPANDHDGKIRPHTQPACLLLDKTAGPTAKRGAVLSKKDAIANIQQESMPIFRRPFGLIGFQPLARFRIEFATLERGERSLGARRGSRAGIFVDNAIKKAAARIFRTVGQGIQTVFEKFGRPNTIRIAVLRTDMRCQGAHQAKDATNYASRNN